MRKKKADMLILNARELLTITNSEGRPKIKEELRELHIIKNGALAIKGGNIVDVGETGVIVDRWFSKSVIDAWDHVVMPGFVDCHTHLIFAGSREKGEGILKTVKDTREASGESLFTEALLRLGKLLKYGTTTVEIKSGYCLSCREIEMLSIISFLGRNRKIDIISTFLGAHVFPEDQPKELYMEDLMWMIKEVSSKNLAKYCDVFCEHGAFSIMETDAILKKAVGCGMKIKLHAGQLNDMGGVELGINYGATSIDHLDFVSDEGIRHLAQSNTIGVLLPACSFHLMINHYAPARKMIDAGVKVALATDFNPG
ncbi:amidohydrolase family protein, partial [Patescibacteria group bacterium]|nr:amidohydrolase family protein [Patescibacteria group bacterium]